MRVAGNLIALLLLAWTVHLEEPETDLEKAIADVEDDPLMAPINNDIEEEKPVADSDVEFVPLPQMNELLKDSENIMKGEKSKVHQAIYHEEQAMDEESKSKLDQNLDQDATDEETKAEPSSLDASEPPFNTDDFDDDYDDIDGNSPQGPLLNAAVRVAG